MTAGIALRCRRDGSVMCWYAAVNECRSLPCFNGATCVDGVNMFTCACAAGYTCVTCKTGEWDRETIVVVFWPRFSWNIQLVGKIQLSNYVKVPIHVIYHPTEFENRKWIQADKLVQIGAWLRNTYSIYALPKIDLPKFALQGKCMENYYPPTKFIEDKDIVESVNPSCDTVNFNKG